MLFFNKGLIRHLTVWKTLHFKALTQIWLSKVNGPALLKERWRRFFPTCQVRVVRFYHSCSSPPPPRLAILLLLFLLVLLLLLLRLFLLDHVCINFHLNFRLANSWPSSLPTSQLSVHRWTSTWDLPSSVCTDGPQPGTCPAQCAPLDLNGQIECQKICQIKCHEICQIECQKICQIECQRYAR